MDDRSQERLILWGVGMFIAMAMGTFLTLWLDMPWFLQVVVGAAFGWLIPESFELWAVKVIERWRNRD